jgi:hypothetical protein
MSSIGPILQREVLRCRFGEQHSSSANKSISNLLFSVLSWLLSLAVSRCYFAAPVKKESEFPRPKRAWPLFSRCIYQRYQSGAAARQLTARGP